MCYKIFVLQVVELISFCILSSYQSQCEHLGNQTCVANMLGLQVEGRKCAVGMQRRSVAPVGGLLHAMQLQNQFVGCRCLKHHVWFRINLQSAHIEHFVAFCM